MVDPLPTNYQDGETVRASHVNAIGTVVNDLRRDVNGFLPSGEVLYSAASVGTLADRPDAETVLNGALYTATDEFGGTTYVAVDGDWVRIAPSESGRTLASAAPSASSAGVALNVANTPFRIPEMTTASFTMPDLPVYVQMSALFTSIGTAGNRTTAQIRYTTDGWSTSHIADARSMDLALTGFEVTKAPFMTMLPPVGGGAVEAGDTVQVALAFTSDVTTKTVSVLHIAANGIFPWLRVVAG